MPDDVQRRTFVLRGRAYFPNAGLSPEAGSGGTYSVTANLLDRRSGLLVTRIEALCDSVRHVRPRAPSHIDVWMVLPDHACR
ncbi:MAG: transposase [Rhodospirillales bacterium]|nr:transposase [Rhodospirillales bacterium]